MKKALPFAPFAFVLLAWRKYRYKYFTTPHHPKVFVAGNMIAYRANFGVWFVKSRFRWLFSQGRLERMYLNGAPGAK